MASLRRLGDRPRCSALSPTIEAALRRNVPASYGAAEPTVAPAAAPSGDRELGIENPHPLIASMWTTVQHSCESAFYGEADWARLRMELWYANRVMSGGQLSSRCVGGGSSTGVSDLLSVAGRQAPVCDRNEATAPG